MAEPLHPLASQHLQPFITAPGETDMLMVVTAVILAGAILAFGVIFFRLHHLPEHMAGGSKKVQLEIVSVLGLIAMLTHINGFWIAALLLAMIDIPDFGGWLGRITGAVERIAARRRENAAAPASSTSRTAVSNPHELASGLKPSAPPLATGIASRLDR
jgi:hypothetical protein